MPVTRWYVSTPSWTVRLDIQAGIIQPTSARYLRRAYGKAWAPWRAWAEREYGPAITFAQLPEEEV